MELSHNSIVNPCNFIDRQFRFYIITRKLLIELHLHANSRNELHI